MKVIHQDCDPTLSEDRSLPYTAFMVEYEQEGIAHYDIVSAAKQVDIFDEYWDKYKNDFKNMTQTEGRVNPKQWNPKNPKK